VSAVSSASARQWPSYMGNSSGYTATSPDQLVGAMRAKMQRFDGALRGKASCLDSTRLVIKRPLEDGKLGITMRGLLVTAFKDPRASTLGWHIGDHVLALNGRSIAAPPDFARELERAIAENRSTGKPLVFDVARGHASEEAFDLHSHQDGWPQYDGPPESQRRPQGELHCAPHCERNCTPPREHQCEPKHEVEHGSQRETQHRSQREASSHETGGSKEHAGVTHTHGTKQFPRMANEYTECHVRAAVGSLPEARYHTDGALNMAYRARLEDLI